MDATIKEKLLKLKRLSASSNIHEAKLAWRKLEQLCEKHGIDPEELVEIPLREIRLAVEGYCLAHRLAGQIIQRVHEVQFLIYERDTKRGPRQIGIVGFENDVMLARTAFLEVVTIMEAGALNWVESKKCFHGYDTRFKPCSRCAGHRKDKHSFYMGVMDRMLERVARYERQKEDEARHNIVSKVYEETGSMAEAIAALEDFEGAETALMVTNESSRQQQIKEMIMEENPGMKHTSSEELSPSDAASFHKGREYGVRIDILPQRRLA